MKPVLFSVAAVSRPAADGVRCGPSFRPDATFKGSTLNGWHAIGAAQWRMENGEIHRLAQSAWRRVARARPLVTGRRVLRIFSMRTGLYDRRPAARGKNGDRYEGHLRFTDERESGALPRHARCARSFLTRETLRYGGGQNRIAPPPDGIRRPPRRRRPARGAAPRSRCPLTPPEYPPAAGEWNAIEIFLDANIVRAFLNNARERERRRGSRDREFGPLASMRRQRRSSIQGRRVQGSVHAGRPPGQIPAASGCSD